MKIRNLILRLGAGVMVFSSVFVSHLCAQSGPISDKYIVLLNPSASPIAVAARHGLAPDFVYQSALHGFAGTIPPGRAPMHSHTYDEIVYVVEGEGVLHLGGNDTPLGPGSCIYLPPLQEHCLENTGLTPMRVLGVFHPSGSPASKAYEANE